MKEENEESYNLESPILRICEMIFLAESAIAMIGQICQFGYGVSYIVFVRSDL